MFEISSIVVNILSGLILSSSALFIQYFRKYLFKKKFWNIWGGNKNEAPLIVFPEFNTPSRKMVFDKPNSKVIRNTCGMTNISTVNSTAGTRGVAYIANVMSDNYNIQPQIKSDVSLDDKMDISFISIGGIVNFKTSDLLDNENNNFISFHNGKIILNKTKDVIVSNVGIDDYGIIVKIRPHFHPNRTWICCAGQGEWGTSGASWWLSKNWKMIFKKVKSNNFACITRTRVGSDDSTVLCHLYKEGEDKVQIFSKIVNKFSDLELRTIHSSSSPSSSPISL